MADSATDTKTDDTANADAGAASIFDAIAEQAAAGTATGTDTSDAKPDATDDKPLDPKTLVADIVAAVKAEMTSEIDRRINGAEKTLAKKFAKTAKPTTKPDPDDDDDEDDDDTPPAAKGPDPRDVRDARRTARLEFGERFKAVSAEERDFVLDVLDAAVTSFALSGDMRDPDRDATRIAAELATKAKAYREHIGATLMADLRRRGLLPEKPGTPTQSGTAGDAASAYEAGKARALARHPQPTPAPS